ncbi:hypothetical protein [Flavobacterium rhizosphaerae]|uniref:Uncharacterized protein n=1 Tax=Flavobacterium rhizosphaerae TaxID=3163298 RepID=A0ABW8YY91_9FLAO
MPLSLGLRDEENQRINNQLNKLVALVFVPEGWNDDELEKLLKGLNLDLDTLQTISNEELLDFLVKCHFDWANMEQLADVLAKLAAKPELSALKQKALAVYNYIQAESKMFSFDIMNKVNALH